MAVAILMIEAVVVYLLVLAAHALRHRLGLAAYYALMGGLTAIMSWVTDAGVSVEVAGVTFLVGSTVFYTALQLGVFVVYAFDGPPATRIAILTVLGVSAMVPVVALSLHLQMMLTGHQPLGHVPIPSLRINLASLTATFVDLVFLAVAWEFLQRRLGRLHLGLRAFLTLLGVMWLDVLLFNTLAFAGTEGFLAIFGGTLLSRLFVCLLASPILWAYLAWQNRVVGEVMEERPVLAILREIAKIERKLTLAEKEIARRQQAESELKRLAATDDLTGLPNRRRFLELAQREFLRARRYRHPLALIMLDLDHFKAINDQQGHQAGDQALAGFAQLARHELRDSDLLGRLGGEEFAVLLPQTEPASAAVVAERIRARLASFDLPTAAGPLRLTVSLGVAALDPALDPAIQSLDALLSRADRALYQAKASGRNQVALAGEPA